MAMFELFGDLTLAKTLLILSLFYYIARAGGLNN
jgi:hypothetical protein